MLYSYPILGSSANITAIAGIVLSDAKGGKTAIVLRPGGVKESTWGQSDSRGVRGIDDFKYQ